MRQVTRKRASFFTVGECHVRCWLSAVRGLPDKAASLVQASVLIFCCLFTVSDNGNALAQIQSGGTAVTKLKAFDRYCKLTDCRLTTVLLIAAPDRAAAVLKYKATNRPGRKFFRFAQSDLTRFRVSDAKGASGETIPLNIALPADAAQLEERYTFLMFRVAPEAISFSAGFRTGANWVVSLRDAHRLTVRSHPSYNGIFSLEVLLYRGVAIAPLRQQITVEIGHRGLAARPSKPATQTSEPPEDTTTTPFEREAELLPSSHAMLPSEEQALLTKGSIFLNNGNIASARFIFEDLALKGSSAGAFALAQTFDPNVLRSVAIIGIKPANIEEAKKWYRIAVERGNRNARDRLGALEGN
jgi:hypothetical protein